MAEPEILLGDEAVGEAAVDAETADANGTVPSPSQQPTSPSDADMEPDLEVFVNNGLKTWQAARELWCRKPIATEDTKISSSNGNNGIHKDGSRRAIELEVDEIIDVLFDPRWRGGGRVKISPVPPRFPINVPLPQMIDILTDLWEAEGLDVQQRVSDSEQNGADQIALALLFRGFWTIEAIIDGANRIGRF